MMCTVSHHQGLTQALVLVIYWGTSMAHHQEQELEQARAHSMMICWVDLYQQLCSQQHGLYLMMAT
jgi:hypothetical protein